MTPASGPAPGEPRTELVCTDLESVRAAVAAGADRIELCAALEVGGVTPGPGLVRAAVELCGDGTDVVVLVRPRRGDFVPTDPGDLSVLRAEVERAIGLGARGVAVGVLRPDGSLDVDAMGALVEAAGPWPVTLHRAIDRTADPVATAVEAASIGVRRVLTSGGAPSAWEGREVIRAMAAATRGELEVIAAAGVRGRNAAGILAATGAGAIHGSCSMDLAPGGPGPALGAAEAQGAPAPRRSLDPTDAAAFVAAARARREGRETHRLTVVGEPRDAARLVAGEILDLVVARPEAVLGLATGRTMEAVYSALVAESRRRGVRWDRVRTVNLDEYEPRTDSDPTSFRAEMQARLFGPLGLGANQSLFPTAEDAASPGAFEERIAALGGIDLQLLGIGGNGHVAFNEPGCERDSRTRRVELAERTRLDAAAAFGGLDAVPTHAVTMGVGTIRAARRLRLLAFGAGKAEIVGRFLDGPVSADVPATFLRGHPDLEVLLDEGSTPGTLP